jgi:hypothetical protein
MISEVNPVGLRIYQGVTYPGYVNLVLGSAERPTPDDVTHMRFLLEPEVPRKHGHRWAMPCQPYCGLNLNRFHITCLTCPIRQIRAGTMPNLIPVRVKWLIVHRNQGGVGKVKAALLKPLLSLVGMLGF